MPATFILPSADNYRGTVYSRPSYLARNPREGNLLVPLSINWGNDSPTRQAVSFNLQNVTTAPLSQVIAMYVNNLMSNVDAIFKFPDIPFQITVPAQSQGLYPVDTSSQQFVVQSGNPGTTSDEVFFDVYNYLPPPIAIERAFITSAAVAAGVLPTTQNVQLLPLGTNGLVTGLSIAIDGALSGAAGGNLQIVVQDGSVSPQTIGVCVFNIPTATTAVPFAQLLSLANVNLPFVNGVVAVQTFTGTAFTSGGVTYNIYHR